MVYPNSVMNLSSVNDPVEKKKKEINMACKSIPILINFIVFILVFIWLCKFIHYAKEENNNRSKYIIASRLDYYEEDEFCHEKYVQFVKDGAYEAFDLKINKLKKWAIALIVLIPSFFVLLIICFCIPWLVIFLILALILIIVFGILFAVHFSKSNFDEFKEFTKCRYLNKQFRKDYDFIYSIKDGFQTPLVFIILLEFFSCFSSISDIDPRN